MWEASEAATVEPGFQARGMADRRGAQMQENIDDDRSLKNKGWGPGPRTRSALIGVNVNGLVTFMIVCQCEKCV